MKIFYIFLFVLVASATNGEKLESETMTEVLLSKFQGISSKECQNFIFHFVGAQAELAVSNEFTETQFIRHRFRISAILETLTKFSIDLYLDSVERMKSTSQDVRNQVNALEASSCTENALDRFERNIIAHVNRLNFCLKEATRILNGEYYDLNYFDKDGARVANQVQNQSVLMMILNDPVDPNIDMYQLINRRLRDLLMRAARETSGVSHSCNVH